MEQFIAIDDVCAWPNLTKMPDGAVVATVFNQPTHGGWEGDVECWISRDEGRSWKLLGVPAPHAPGTNRMNVAAGLAHDGSLIVLASGWSHRQKRGDYSSPHEGRVLAPWVCRSSDGGVSWTHSESVSLPEDEAFGGIPFGDIVRHADGTLGACLYGENAEGNRSMYFSSSDDGLTWALRGTIEAKNTNETTPFVLADEALIVAARTLTSGQLELHWSGDQGQSWTSMGPLTMPGQIPGHLLGLTDGRILLSYGLRNRGMHGVAIRLSEDSGATWGQPRIIVNYQADVDGGYPSSIQAADGTIVTAYYCAGIETHKRYHMGVVRWTLD